MATVTRADALHARQSNAGEFGVLQLARGRGTREDMHRRNQYLNQRRHDQLGWWRGRRRLGIERRPIHYCQLVHRCPGNSPIVTSGTISINPTSGLTKNDVLATPNGSTGAVSLRALVAADLPAVPLSTGVTGTSSIANGGTGQITAALAINALLPSQTGQSGNFLTTNGTVASWAAVSGGGGSPTFDTIASGTNLTAAMLVGTGASLGPTGTGTISANQVNREVFPRAQQSLRRILLASWSRHLLPAQAMRYWRRRPPSRRLLLGAATATTESITGNGAVSAPAFLLSGAPYTGGSGTTTYPYIYGNDGTSPTTWSTAGTYLGFNAPSGFTGNFEDDHVNGGASVYSVSYQGKVVGGTYNGSTIPTSAGTLPGSSGAFTNTDCVIVHSTSPLEIADGGACTGVGSATNGQILYNSSSSVAGVTAVTYANGGTGLTGEPTNGQLAIGNGTGYTLATLTAGSGMTVTNGAGTITLAASLSASAGNPTAKVGVTAVNGSASTFMRSDGAPPIDLTATYAWTGPHSFADGITAYDSASGGPFNVGNLGAPDNTTAISYTLVAADPGKRVTVTVTGKVITIPHAVFADGDVVTILFDTAGTATLTPDSSFTLNWANGTTSTYGTGSAGNRTLTGWAVATLIFTSSSVAYLTGTGIS